MKISIFLLTISVLQVFAKDSYSQTTRLTLSMNNATVEQVLDKIEDQSEFFFLYNHQLVDVNRKVDIHVKNKKIKDILDDMLTDTDVSYVVMGRQIILSPKDVLKTNTTKTTQGTVVTGKVTSVNGEPLIGATVVIKGTTIGTATDVNGNFSLSEVPSGKVVLTVSYIGYLSKEVVPEGGTVNVTLDEDIYGLEQVSRYRLWRCKKE